MHHIYQLYHVCPIYHVYHVEGRQQKVDHWRLTTEGRPKVNRGCESRLLFGVELHPIDDPFNVPQQTFYTFTSYTFTSPINIPILIRCYLHLGWYFTCVAGAKEEILSGRQRSQPCFAFCHRPLPHHHQTHKSPSTDRGCWGLNISRAIWCHIHWRRFFLVILSILYTRDLKQPGGSLGHCFLFCSLFVHPCILASVKTKTKKCV